MVSGGSSLTLYLQLCNGIDHASCVLVAPLNRMFASLSLNLVCRYQRVGSP
jgi:hypothetical protein